MARSETPYHHGDLRRALLVEAARIVETDGVGALTFRELGRRLGVSHAAPANHFADKAALLAELAAEGFDELATALEVAAGEGRTPAAHLRAAGRAYVTFARRKPGHFRVMFAGGFSRAAPSPHLATAGARAYTALEGPVVAALAGRRTPERIREASFLAWSVVHGAAMLILDAPMSPHLAAPGDQLALQALVDQAIRAVSESISG